VSAPIQTQRGAPDPGRGAYERTDVDPTAARLTLSAMIGTVALVCAGVAGLFALFGGLREPARPAPPQAQPAPLLQTDERADRAEIEARAIARLHASGGGVAIDEAMRRTAAAGWDGPR
jgi:hypothetical protein